MRFWILTIFLSTSLSGWSQEDLSYYLPSAMSYDKNIPTPKSVLGYEVGDWHMSHDQLVYYLRSLAAASDRIQLQEIGRTYEQRPLLLLIVSSKKNLDRLEDIRKQHLQWSDPTQKTRGDASKMPLVVYQGFTVHGNEASGSHAAALLAYHLAAGKGRDLERMLDETVILLDPCLNPDGFNRFTSWVNVHKSHNLSSDPQSREFDEVWPGGRTNHYWFDLNRDWLPLQHPESKARLEWFHRWKPNILTDHHEMGRNNTFFFQPGVPERTNPITPGKNQELTAALGEYHAAGLDAIGSLYYTKESFDDFYYGKGSTYPDVNGSIGILFEQASSRGHLVDTDNGLLSFPFTIRNQFRAALGTLEGGQNHREDLINYQREFYESALEEASQDKVKGYLFSEPHDPARLSDFIEMLGRHQVECFQLSEDMRVNNELYPAAYSFVVPMEQPQYRLIRAMFESQLSFPDSVFYDVSTWTLPLAYNLRYTALNKGNFPVKLEKKAANNGALPAVLAPEYSDYAYVFEWDHAGAPRALAFLQSKGVRAKVASKAFEAGGRSMDVGSILVAVQTQDFDAEALYELIQQASSLGQLPIYDIDTGLSSKGIDLGSPSFSALKAPRIAVLVGDGISSYDAGEVWFLFDQRYKMPITLLDAQALERTELADYTAIVLPGGNYRSISGSGTDKLRQWVQQGGVLVALEEAVRWVSSRNLATLKFRTEETEDAPPGRRAYAQQTQDAGSQRIGGIILAGDLDRSHPLGYGFNSVRQPVFRSNRVFMEPAKNPYATPLQYETSPLLSGYCSEANLKLLAGGAGIVVSATGSGRVISMADNPVFRGFWRGSEKLLANAVFFGSTIRASACE